MKIRPTPLETRAEVPAVGGSPLADAVAQCVGTLCSLSVVDKQIAVGLLIDWLRDGFRNGGKP